MSQNFTYNVIAAQLTSYSERTDAVYVAQIPVFISLAENRLATEMKQQGFQAVVDGTMDLSNVQKKPSFWRETISFGYFNNGVFQPLFLRPLEYLRAYWPNTAIAGVPKYYADYNINNFYVAGTPATKFPFELVYYARLDPLSVDHQENWMTLNVPQALLYAALLEAALWRKNSNDIAKWTDQYRGAVAAILKENIERLADRGQVVERG